MQKNNILVKLGLAPKSALIYQSLIASGASTIAGIAKNTGLYRPVVYHYIPLLVNKGLVSETNLGKRVLYTAEHPNALNNLAQDLQNDFLQTLPVLVKTYEKTTHQPVIRYFKGRQGIAHVFDYLLRTAKKGDIIYRYESPTDYSKNKRYYPPLYIERTTGKSSIQKFVITNEQTHLRRRPQLERYSKAVPPGYDLFAYDITQLIYGSKVAFIDYKTETASIIESETFANFQRKIFRLLFDKL